MAYREAIQWNTPDLSPPLAIFASSPPSYNVPPLTKSSPCHLSSCFDHSRCALTSGLPVYLYEYDDVLPISSFLRTGILQTVGYNPHYTSNPKEACIYIVLIGEGEGSVNLSHLKKLPYWGGDGRNHLLLYFSRQDLSLKYVPVSPELTSRAIVVQSTFLFNNFRRGFDIIVPPVLGAPGGDVWEEAASMLPARRKVFISFQGKRNAVTIKPGIETDDDDDEDFVTEFN
ncbi:exostosin-3-like [Lycorma delicatula]|uniref:exostosin-3-like n=1 Tax=Lycorma delicatula TaxID=130591 RepID=UPI003F50F149